MLSEVEVAGNEGVMPKPETDCVITPAQCRGGRAMLQLSREKLAELARVSPATIKNYENGRTVMRAVELAIEHALTGLGVQLIDANGGGPGVRLGDRAPPAALSRDAADE